MLTSLHGRPASASITRNQLSSHPAVVSCLSPALFARSFVKIYCESNKCRPLNCRNCSASSALIRRPEFVMGSSSQGSSRWPTGFPELGANDQLPLERFQFGLSSPFTGNCVNIFSAYVYKTYLDLSLTSCFLYICVNGVYFCTTSWRGLFWTPFYSCGKLISPLIINVSRRLESWRVLA